jgi:hypothetical protein
LTESLRATRFRGGEASNLSNVYGREQIINAYNANPSLPPLSFLPDLAPIPPDPVVYPAFPVADQALLETALLQACDALDGVADGVVDNPPACKAKFDPATATYTSGGATFPLQCTGPKNATCLSPAQIQAAKKLNQGPRNSAGQAIAAPSGAVANDPASNVAQGFVWDGGWMTTGGIPPTFIGAPGTLPDIIYDIFGYAFLSPAQPTFYRFGFDFDTDLGLLSPNTPVDTYATSLDISRFVEYYEEMAQQFGGLGPAQQFSRFYPVPNKGHCLGGPATSQFDLLTPLVNWVENGTPPGPINATGVNFTPAAYQVSFVQGPATRTRPLCPYPQQARLPAAYRS